MRSREIALRAHTVDRVFVGMAPAASHTPQTRRALRVRFARFALTGFSCRFFGRRGRAIEPLAAQSELVLAGVDAEAEALSGRFAPDAAPAFVETVLALQPHSTGRRARGRVDDGPAGSAAPSAARLVRPPLAVVPGHAALAADVVGAVRAGGRLQREVPPLAVVCACSFLVDVPVLAAIRQLAPPASRVR